MSLTVSRPTPTPPRYAGPPTVPGYVLHEFLGRGAYGVVWSGTAEASGARVAVKVLPASLPDRDPLADSDRERALGRCVETVHLVRALDRVILDDGRVALVLDLADGGSLRDIVTLRGRLPLGEVVTALTPLASALAELHDAGIVHADVAPGNVLFAADGRPLLADLSSARLVDEDPWPDSVLGTPGFIAPEVSQGGPPGPSADVWSLGALAWYARTGGSTPPPEVGDLHWMRGGAGESRDVTLDEVTAAVGPELRPVLLRMLATDPQARPSAREAALALYRVADPVPVGLVGHHPDPAAAVTSRIRRDAAQTRSRTQLKEQARTERRRARGQELSSRVSGLLHPRAARRTETLADGIRRRPPGWRLAVVGLLALAVTGGLLLLLRGTSEGTPELTPDPTAGAASAAPATTRTSDASTATSPSPGPALDPVAAAPVTATTVDPGHDPASALQAVADRRAAALVAADPVALLQAEPSGSDAYQADAAVVSRLREQRQRYADLTFVVRSASVEHADPSHVVVRAVVDRSAYSVVGDDGSTQTAPAAAGTALRYTLALTDSGWRLTDVASG